MMKRVIAVLAVVVMMGVSSIAFAASDISVSGQIDFRSRDFNNLGLDKEANGKTAGTQEVDTQERVRLEVNVKADDVAGKISIENDWDTWGRNERYQADGTSGVFLKLREAWIGFRIPDTPIGIKAGHQLLALSNGWFYRAMKYGADAWVVYTDIDAIHLGFVDIKASEGVTGRNGDDIDAYALVANYKLDDKNTVGANWTIIKDRAASFTTATVTALGRLFAYPASPFGSIEAHNLSVFYAGKIGAIGLKAEVDWQMGKIKVADDIVGDDVKLTGNQIVLQGDMALDPVTINATFARGSGIKEDDEDKINQIVTLLDADRHYTLLFEYKIAHAQALNLASTSASGDMLHTGFANVTALNVGVSAKVGKSLTVGAQAWMLQSTEKITTKEVGSDDTSKDLGTELDANINWQITPSLSWNWDLGYFRPGKAYIKTNGDKADSATGIQGVLSFKF